MVAKSEPSALSVRRLKCSQCGPGDTKGRSIDVVRRSRRRPAKRRGETDRSPNFAPYDAADFDE